MLEDIPDRVPRVIKVESDPPDGLAIATRPPNGTVVVHRKHVLDLHEGDRPLSDVHPTGASGVSLGAQSPGVVCVSVDESGKKGWPKLDGPQRGQVHPGLLWPDAVGARRRHERERGYFFPWVPDSGWPLPLAKAMGWQNGGKMAQKGGKMATFAGTCYVTIYDTTPLLPCSCVNCRRKKRRETNSHNHLFIKNLRRKHGFPNSRQAGKT